MKFLEPVSVKWISSFIDAELVGDENKKVTGINEIHSVEPGDIVFVDHPKYYLMCLNSAASFILINKKIEAPENKCLLIIADPFEAYLKIVQHFKPFTASQKMISDNAVIGEGTTLMPNIFIGNNVVIGSNCIIHPNVTIYDNCVIGDNVIIHSGTVIGGDAFYYNAKKNRNAWYKKMDSCGRVIIKNDVEIGCCCTIDRGVSGDTIIGAGCKLDNSIHLGHEVILGDNCLIAAQAGIAGCTVVGSGVVILGQVGISKTLTIGDNSLILSQSGVAKNLEANKTYFGTPAEPALQKHKENIWIKRIPEMWNKLMAQPDKNF